MNLAKRICVAAPAPVLVFFILVSLSLIPECFSVPAKVLVSNVKYGTVSFVFAGGGKSVT